MPNSPELTIIYNANHHPISAKCSACGEVFPEVEVDGTSAENIERFVARFNIHKLEKHYLGR
ncbi:MAG: hypothetical protein ABSE46_10555 [Terracidiphilus sp.]|jgi:hypothetical protein